MDPAKSAVERIADMIDDVGLSITMTSLTSTMAFGLGCLSTIPAIFWLCLYGFPTVIIVYLYQITFFVACMVLDENRIEANKRDCCCCLAPRPIDNDTSVVPVFEQRGHVVDHLMQRFAHSLLKPYVKGIIAILFLGLAGGLSYSAAQLEQGFDFKVREVLGNNFVAIHLDSHSVFLVGAKDMLPDDSYLKDAFDAIDDYQARSGAAPFVYFRYVNQADPAIQDQMTQYVMDLVEIESIEEEPEEFWLWGKCDTNFDYSFRIKLIPLRFSTI
jgi:Niemann-Pick C1 protein